MSDIQNKRNTGKSATTISVFFGFAIGAVLGLLAYTNDWLG